MTDSLPHHAHRTPEMTTETAADQNRRIAIALGAPMSPEAFAELAFAGSLPGFPVMLADEAATAYRACYEALTAANRNLGNLLAIIHRDGGHYSAEFGVEKATEDAHLVWANLIGRAEAAEAALTTVREATRDEAWELLGGPCQCDPPGSGEEFCHDTCIQKERADELAQEVARLKAEHADLIERLKGYVLVRD